MVQLDFFLGVVAMQVIYLLYHYILFRKNAFLYYLLFVIGISSFIALIFGLPSLKALPAYIDRHALGFSILFPASAMYYRFIRLMSEAPRKYPYFNKIVIWIEYSLFLTGLILGTDTLLNGEPVYTKNIVRVIYLIGFLFQVYIMVFLVRTRSLLNILIVMGGFIMSLIMKIALIPIAFNTMDLTVIQISSYVLFGVIIDFLFLSFVLVYQSRLWQAEKAELIHRKKEELQQQRNEISSDLHDDIGASLSSIHVYSSVALNSIPDTEKVKGYLEKIQFGIRGVMERMNDVIWAVKSENEIKTPLSAKLKNHFVEVLDATNIQLHYEIEDQAEESLQSVLARKNMLLICKEAVNNVVKHSKATEIHIKMKQQEEHILFEVFDNGKGIDTSLLERGNGIGSMRSRTAQMNGTIKFLTGEDGRGTRIICRIPIASVLQ